jgi:hypothetical protein
VSAVSFRIINGSSGFSPMTFGQPLRQAEARQVADWPCSSTHPMNRPPDNPLLLFLSAKAAGEGRPENGPA